MGSVLLIYLALLQRVDDALCESGVEPSPGEEGDRASNPAILIEVLIPGEADLGEL